MNWLPVSDKKPDYSKPDPSTALEIQIEQYRLEELAQHPSDHAMLVKITTELALQTKLLRPFKEGRAGRRRPLNGSRVA